MRRLLCLALASTFLTAAPAVIVPQEVVAQSLFDNLFPRASERRKQRRAERYRRQLQAQRAWQNGSNNPARTARVPKTRYYNYKAEALKPVAWTVLAASFAEPETAQAEASVAADTSVAETPIVETPVVSKAFDLKNGVELLSEIDVSARKDVGKAVLGHYKSKPEFSWIDETGAPNSNARAVMAVLADADAMGLNAADYAVEWKSDDDASLTTASTAPVDAKEAEMQRAMQFEFSLTTAALRYAMDARHGTVDPDKISGYHDFSANKRKPVQALAAIMNAANPADVLKDSHPQMPEFQALVNELKSIDNAVSGPPPVQIAEGTFVRPGRKSDQLEQIVEGIRRKADDDMRAKHAEVLAASHVEGLYNEPVVALVKDYQKSRNLTPDGIIGRQTIGAIIGAQPENKRAKVLMAMERLRWHPDTFGETHVFINQPAYRASYIEGGEPTLSMRAIVGKRSNQTNFFHDTIEYVEFNPYWGVPRSILVNEKLPKLRQDPGYLDDRNYEISTLNGRPISGWNIDWYSVGADFPFNVRQRPGPKNALGELKIMFPNKHHIYMHDTPSRNLFKRSARALSHGCVRLADPKAMAAAVLGTSKKQVNARIRAGKNDRQNVKTKIPVYVAYFTAWPKADGTVEYFGDIYGRDEALSKAMAKTRAARTKALSI